MSRSPRTLGATSLAEREGGSAAFIARKARALDASLAKAIRRVMTNADDEALHDMRVAIRRLRTLLRLARPIYGSYRTSAVRKAFTRVQSKTGELRDDEALSETLGGLSVDDPALTAW